MGYMKNVETITLSGKKYAVIPYDEFKELEEYLEDIKDIADANEIKAKIERGDGEYFPAAVVNAVLDGKNPLKVYREYRKLTQEELAKKALVSASLIRKIENGENKGSIKTIKAIAEVLKINVERLLYKPK